MTALVVAADPADRAGTADLLRIAGWEVAEASGTADTLRLARRLDADLVVVHLPAEAGEGPALLRRLRLAGCRAHLVAVAGDAGPEDRAAALTAGAVACLSGPVGPALLRDLLRRRVPAPVPAAEADGGVDPALIARLQELYARALPGRVTAIAEGARAGDAVALASASATLAGTSAQLGHPEVAAVCRAIARDARRGVLAHDLVGELRAVAGA